MLENAVNQREQDHIDGKMDVKAGIFGTKCGRKPISDSFYHKLYQVF